MGKRGSVLIERGEDGNVLTGKGGGNMLLERGGGGSGSVRTV